MHYLLIISMLFHTLLSASEVKQYTASTNPNVAKFINYAVTQHKLEQQDVIDVLAHSKYDSRIIKKISSPYEDLSWLKYRRLLLTQKRIDMGMKFHKKYAKTLQLAEDRSGVPASIIASIIGIESNFSQVKMPFRVIDALATLSFDYPKRASFFQSELIAFIKLVKKLHLHTPAVYGSYAGAIGIPQFMPSNYLLYAQSSNRLQSPNLISSTPDSILSVGNYLKLRGKWTPNAPVIKKYNTAGQILEIKPGTLIRLTPKQKDILGTQDIDNVVGAWCSEDNTCWLLYNNFFSIYSYNPSPKYAMAVIELSKAIQ